MPGTPPNAESPAPRKSHYLRTIFLIFVIGIIACLYLLPDDNPATGAAVPTESAAPSGANFSNAVSSGVHLVDFWATWCGPCKMQAPIVSQVARHYAGKVNVLKVDVDKEEDLARKFGIEGIPTIIIFKNGREAARFVGVTEEETLNSTLERLL